MKRTLFIYNTDAQNKLLYKSILFIFNFFYVSDIICLYWNVIINNISGHWMKRKYSHTKNIVNIFQTFRNNYKQWDRQRWGSFPYIIKSPVNFAPKIAQLQSNCNKRFDLLTYPFDHIENRENSIGYFSRFCYQNMTFCTESAEKFLKWYSFDKSIENLILYRYK